MGNKMHVIKKKKKKKKKKKNDQCVRVSCFSTFSSTGKWGSFVFGLRTIIQHCDKSGHSQ